MLTYVDIKCSERNTPRVLQISVTSKLQLRSVDENVKSLKARVMYFLTWKLYVILNKYLVYHGEVQVNFIIFTDWSKY